MAKPRKTFKVEDFKKKVNAYLLNSSDNMVESREGQGMLLASILMDSGNYRGFRHLTQKDMYKSEYGTTIGINTYNSTEELKKMQKTNTLFLDTDKSRVLYF